MQASNFDFGLKAYEEAVNISHTESQKASDVVEVAECVFKLSGKDEALQRIMDEIGKTKESEALSLLYVGVARIYNLARDYEFRALALDKVLEITPNDTNVRFLAGYSYGQGDTKNMSYLHYKILLEFDPKNKMALNNIGVECDVMGMPIHSIQYYKKSAANDETLAMANLAYKYLGAGFKEEASEILVKAKNKENVHQNVGSALSAVVEKIEEEEKAEEKIIGEAREQQRFLLKFAGAYFTKIPECPQFGGTWVTSDGGEMIISKKDKIIEAYWSSNDKKYKLTGMVSNRGAKITIFSYKYVLSKRDYDYDKDSNGYGYITEDGQQLNIMNISGKEHSMMKLVRR